MNRSWRVFIVTFLLLLTILIPSWRAQAIDDNATAIASGLKSLIAPLDALADLPQLNQAIPATSTSLGQALQLGQLFEESLGSAIGGTSPADVPSYDSLAQLSGVIDAADGAYSGVDIRFDNVVISDLSADGLIDTQFQVNMSRSLDLPVSLLVETPADQADQLINGGTFAMTPTLTVDIILQLDTNSLGTEPNNAFYLATPPTVSFNVLSDVAIPPFSGRFGFTEVSASGLGQMDLLLAATFQDPDGDGRITRDEWENTSLVDLVTAGLQDQPGQDLRIELNLDTSLTPAAVDGQISLIDDNLADGLNEPSYSLDLLENFLNVTRVDVLNSLNQMAGILLATQATGDMPLPFLQEDLSDVFDFADPLLQFIHRQGDAAVLCGSVEGNPPLGDISQPEVDDPLYCRAITFADPTSVTWSISNGTPGSNTSGIDALETVGLNPTNSAVFTYDGPGKPDIQVTFTDPDGEDHTVEPLFLTAQELAQKLVDLGGFNAVTPVYDSDSESLSFNLQASVATQPISGTLNFGDQLKSNTQLFGLNPTDDAAVSIQPANVSFDLTFGMMLLDDVNQLAPGGDVSDRFFLKTRNGAGEHEFTANVGLTVDQFELAGRLGFLEVIVGQRPGGPLFSITNPNPGQPMLALDLNAPGFTAGGINVADAVRLNDLLDDLGSYVSVECHAAVAAGLQATAQTSDDTPLASGGIDISWNDVFGTACAPETANLNVTPLTDFNHGLQVFDIDSNNPVALLSLILDNLDLLAAGLDGLSGNSNGLNFLDARIPLASTTPRDLVTQLDTLRDVTNEMRANPPGTLQALESALETALDIPANALALSLENGTPGGDPATLMIQMGYGRDGEIAESLNLDLGNALPDLVSLDASSTFSLTYGTHAQLDIGIPLSATFDPGQIFIADTTGLDVTAGISTDGISLSASAGPITLDVSGEAQADAVLTLGLTGDVLLANIDTLPGSVLVTLDGPASPNNCGTVDGTDLVGDACARLAVSLQGVGDLGEVGFLAPDIADPAGWPAPIVPSDLLDNLANSVLDWNLLLEALPGLMTQVQNQLENSGNSVPVVGESLDAGADVVGLINSNLVQPLSSFVTTINNPAAVETEVQDLIYNALSGSGLLLDQDIDGDSDADDISVFCNEGECASVGGLLAIDDVRVQFYLGQGVSDSDAAVGQGCDSGCEEWAEQGWDVDTGLPGLPLRSQGALAVSAGWKLIFDFGLSRAEGPYLVADHGSDEELQLGASLALGEPAGGCAATAGDWPDTLEDSDGFSTARCLSGTVGFLQATFYDGNNAGDGDEGNNPSKLSLGTTLDITGGNSNGRIPLAQIGSGSVALDFNAEANLDLRFRTGLSDAFLNRPGQLPSVIGAFHLDWQLDSSGTSAPTVGFDNLYLDVGNFVNSFTGPMVEEVRSVTSPLKPVIDAFQAPLPGLSDLAEMVGQEPISLRTIAETAAGDSIDFTLIDRVFAIIQFVNDLPAETDLFIPLGGNALASQWQPTNGQLLSPTVERSPGSFSVKPDLAAGNPLTPDQADDLVDAPNAGGQLMSELNDDLNGRTTDAGVSFPFMEDAGNIFALLMGQDVTLVHFDAGTLRAVAVVEHKFPPIFVGPVPISIGLSGSARIEGHFAMGYDTSGLRKVIEGESVGHLLNGIFIDDLDSNGVDIPEIKLVGTIAASASVDVFVAEAGVRGGIELTIKANLDDRPEPDGKLRIEEIVEKLKNPVCLFEFSGNLDAFIEAFAEVGVCPFCTDFSLEIIRVTLLEFSAACDPANPTLYEDSGDTLILKMGRFTPGRNIAEGELGINEQFVVRQLTAGLPARFSIEAFGVYQETPGFYNKILAYGDAGNDMVALEAGATADGTPIPFTAEATIFGGSGNDRITAGRGDDNLCGGSGNDRLSGGGGMDLIAGDQREDGVACDEDGFTAVDGADVIDGGRDDDTLYGGGENDVITGGPGGDTIYGNEGLDTLSGGPGGTSESLASVQDQTVGSGGSDRGWSIFLPLIGGGSLTTSKPTAQAKPIASAPVSYQALTAEADLADTIYGGPGDDTISGHQGNDQLYGDEALSCDADGSSDGGADQIFGGEGADNIWGGYGDDELLGESEDDTICGNGGDDLVDGDDDDPATPDGNDHLFGGSGHDNLLGRAGNDDLHGGDDGDDLQGGPGRDLLYGDQGPDILLGDSGQLAAHPAGDHTAETAIVLNLVLPGNGPAEGPAIDSCAVPVNDPGNADCLFGGPGNDFLFGEGGHDRLYGEANDDYMDGNSGEDLMEGGSGDDNMHGGQDADLMHGNDNDDVMYGDSGHDRMFGDDGSDTMRGGMGDDYMEGNGDDDTMFGEADQDDMIGGSGSGGAADSGDTMRGGSGQDVMAGDNASITRPTDGQGDWLINEFDGSVVRDVTLHEVSIVGTPANAAHYGDDHLYGEAHGDTLYGQGGVDQMWGGDGDDFMQGNAEGDVMHGDGGNDDMVGGTGRINADPDTGTDGRLDGIDVMHGGDGYDVMAGDNAILQRVLEDGQWVSNSFNDGIQHLPRQLLDVESADAALVSGGDFMYGDAHDDLMYGQGGEDQMWGGDGDDFMEGNTNSDTMHGDGDQDDIIGGTVNAALSDAGDFLYGDAGADVLLGDNGTIQRPLQAGQWIRDPNPDDSDDVGVVIRDVVLLDVALVDVNVPADYSGADQMWGGDGHDRMFGQGAGDTMHGGAGADMMEGNHDTDWLYGDGGEDDLIGGGSADDGVIDADRAGDNLQDKGDYIFGDDGDSNSATGGDDGDVIAGDNARIDREPVGGLWQVDPNSQDVIRTIVLFDVEHVSSDAPHPEASGSDQLWGEGGRDLIFGQGNDSHDDDGDGRFEEDPGDGIDNDRDGREDPTSETYDCADGRDNDGDNLVDAEEASCQAAVDEDGGGDEIHGGDGDDYLEGNHGGDWMFGDAGQDDMIGGSSAGDGHIGSGVSPANLADGDDTMRGGADDDVMLADNGIILRPVNASTGLWQRLQGGDYDIVRRLVIMEPTPEQSGGYGDDHLSGDDGHDEMYGQMGHDFLDGNAGDDVLVGDLGQVTSNVEDGSREQFIETRAPFLEDTIYAADSLHRLVELYSFQQGDGAEGDDILLGGPGQDNAHGGAGDDLMNGNDGEDHLFGGDGNDAGWGGPGHDHLWGGYHDDHLDVKPREARWVGHGANRSLEPADPAIWFVYATADNYQDLDTIYGGWDRDAMQANLGGPGPQSGDRLLDWVGAYNVYYTCPGAYGEGVITRSHAPNVVEYLRLLMEGDGGLQPGTPGSSGFNEMAIVLAQDSRYNANPPHPENPGHFTCN